MAALPEQEAFLREHYTQIYDLQGDKHDSAERSRLSMNRRIHEALLEGLPIPRVLEVGSGPQAMLRQLLRAYNRTASPYEFITIDLAKISKKNLLCSSFSNVAHSAGNGTTLPFINSSFGMFISNWAIEIMPDSAFAEATRVLSPGGKALFNFLHPYSISKHEPSITSHGMNFGMALHTFNKDFCDTPQISGFLGQFRLQANRIVLAQERDDFWWEVDAVKLGRTA